MDKDRILQSFSLFRFGARGGIGTLFTPETDEEVFRRLCELSGGCALSMQELNQLLLLAHEACVTQGFFAYYWLEAPEHTYDVRAIDGYDASWLASRPKSILSLEHFKWGLYRLYVDALLYFGNVRTAFRHFRIMRSEELSNFFQRRRIDTRALMDRGPALPLRHIPNEHRYLVSEMVSRSYGADPQTNSELKKALLEAWHLHSASGGGRTRVRDLMKDDAVKAALGDRYERTSLSATALLDEFVASESEIGQTYDRAAALYSKVRSSALRNTDLYLSMVNELDVYVATSMRLSQDFEQMAHICKQIFSAKDLQDFNLRYFDPTLCAARGHEDKGLTECLMVKCAKVLVYCAGEKESYGKDAEAAMALSLGKPVVFYCNDPGKKNFYRDTHPLTRLIDFESGVAVGAMITDSPEQVAELLARTFENRMHYKLEQRPNEPGYLRLIERQTNSVIRVQTNNDLITETFWNHYHNRRPGEALAMLSQ
jgi:hypothetical protein